MSFFQSGFVTSGATGLGEQAPVENEIQTTDATEATIASVAVASGQTVRVEAWITGNMSSGTKTGSWHLAALFKRVGTGNVALVGVPQDVASFSDATVSWAVDVEADTTNQTIDFNVTGAAGETVKWTIRVNYTVQEG
jgi:hypothetical protein